MDIALVLNMNGKHFINKLIGQSEMKGIFILIFNSFSWYFPLYIFFVNMLESFNMKYSTVLLVYFLHYVSTVISALVGNFLAHKIKRSNLLILWMLIGVAGSFLMFTIESGETMWIFLTSIFLGLSLGLGFPSCLAYFADNVDIGQRGFIGGVISFTAFIGMAAVGFFTTLLNHLGIMLFFAIWRSIGLVIFLLVRPKVCKKGEMVEVSYQKIFLERSFILYYIPWVIFCLINFLEIPFFDIQLQQYFLGTNLRYLISIGEFGIGGISALVGGLLSDIFGRKRIVVSAYIMLGMGYAVLSFSFSSLITLYLYVLLDGIAWGIFSLMFYFVVWGDLAENRTKEKLYFVGILPFLIASFVSFVVTPYSQYFPISTAFSLASFFLFLAVVPLMYAPETLPEKAIRERELKSYIEKAKRIKDKFT